MTSLVFGLVVFILWINMDWDVTTMGSPDAYDPGVLPSALFYIFIVIRIFGASVIVPSF